MRRLSCSALAFAFLLSLMGSFLQASCCCENSGHQLFIGPEIYYVKRTKEGGAQQSGPLYGVRAGYERIKRYKFYWGLDGLYARGTIKGKVADQRLKSELIDSNVEVRMGYTFASKCGFRPSLTPFFGVGRFWEKNDYQSPSPQHFHFHNHFLYIPAGFLSHLFITENFSIGLNFKARFILEGKIKVSNDPEFGDSTQNYEEKVQYRVELPLLYETCWCDQQLGIGLTPFYEYRPYGKRVNFPFDFLETKFKLYGATVKLMLLF